MKGGGGGEGKEDEMGAVRESKNGAGVEGNVEGNE